MEEIKLAIGLAVQKFKEKYGQDAELEEGEEFVTAFNNCTLVISLKTGELETKFIPGRPLEIDMELSIYKGE